MNSPLEIPSNEDNNGESQAGKPGDGRDDKQNDKETSSSQEIISLTDQVSKITKTVAEVAAAIVASTFVFYVLGFVIVNSYLSSFGIRDFSFNKPSYLGAGIVFLFANVTPILIPVFLYIYMEELNRYFRYIFSILSFPLTIYVIFYYVTNAFKYFGYPIIQKNFFGYMNSYVIILLMIAVIFISRPKSRSSILYPILIIVGVLPYFLFTWGETIYQVIGPEFSGGDRTKIQIVLADGLDPSSLTEIGVGVNGIITDKLELIDEGAEFITVVNNKGNAAKISKDIVLNILYLSERNDRINSQVTATPEEVPTAPP